MRPGDLSDGDQEDAAQHILGLVDRADFAKIQSYIEFQKQKYFESSPGDPDVPVRVKHARWAHEFYYKHVREFLASESLQKRMFAHHYHGSTFVPVIPPQTLGYQEKHDFAFAAVSRMKPEHVAAVDAKLGGSLDEFAEVLELSGRDPQVTFKEFLENKYFRIMDLACESHTAASKAQSSGSAVGPLKKRSLS